MLTFILEILIMVSLGAILYLVAKTLPRIDDRELDASVLRTHWLMVYLEKFDEKFKYYFEKTLRRLGIIILKLDNLINKKLNQLKKEKEIPETGFPAAPLFESEDSSRSGSETLQGRTTESERPEERKDESGEEKI